MNNILNSSATQWLLKWGLSKIGLVTTAAVTWAFTKFDLARFLTPEDATTLQGNIEKGVVAAAMVFVAWLIERQKRGVKVMQQMANESSTPSETIRVDGIAGNKTICAQAEVTGVDADKAISVVAEPKHTKQ